MEMGFWVFAIFAVGSLVSVIAKRPWTSVFARLQNPPEVCQSDLFRETNMVLSGLWTLLFMGGALLATLGSPWLNFLYGGSFGLLGYYSKRLGSWYSSWRLASKERSN